MNEAIYNKTVSARTLDHWFREYTPRLLRNLRKYRMNQAEYDDIVQETWLTVMRSGYNGDGVFSAYIQRIAENKALDLLRTQKRRPVVPLDREGIELHAFSGPSTMEARALMRFMCLQLSLVQCMAYITIQYAGLSYQEAGAQLHAPVATLKTRIRRCTTLLREPARYSTFPCSIALPVGYAPAGSNYSARPQEDREYTLFESRTECTQLEVVCVH